MQNGLKEEQNTKSNGELPPIPTPVGTRWRELRVTYFPIVVFCVSVVAIWKLWTDMPPANALRGIGEGAVSTLASPQDGFLDGITVPPHGWAEAGQPIVTVIPFDPGAHLDLFQSQLQISRLALEPTIADRNAVNYEQLRVDALRLKQELAMAKANLDRAEKVLPRHEELLKERLISRDIYDLSVRDRDYYQAEVREKSKASEEIDQRLEELRAFSQPGIADTNSAAAAMIPRLEQEIASVQTNWNPVTLLAPISGEVNYYRQAREFVRAGELVALINSARADRIIAYMKQPIPFEPEIGMTMEVTTRSQKRQRFLTEIAQIGARVEVITNAIAYVQAGALVDTGLPLILPVPEDVTIRPGEIVDVVWRSSPGEKPSLTERLLGKN